MEKHGTTVYFEPRRLSVDAVLFGPDLESHYIQCIRDMLTVSSNIHKLKARPDIEAVLDCFYDALKRARDLRREAEAAGPAPAESRVTSNTRQKSQAETT